MKDSNQLILQTKLHPPRLPHDLVERTRLLVWLMERVDTPLTLVCAPAGYGKTTLICTWLERMSSGRGEGTAFLPSAWLSLDKDDSDLNLFLRYFIAALRTIFADACAKTLALLQAGQSPPQAILRATLFNDLEELPGDAIVVLDDYQFIHGKVVHNLLIELSRHWPKPLRLVLISRIDPPLPLLSLRAKGVFREIRTHDLRFLPQETDAYLDQLGLPRLSQSTLELLERRFEGWPAGLQLAALSLRSADSQESVLLALSSQNADIISFLVDEVLTHQLPAIHEFLLKSSLLDRFCRLLCEAAFGEIDPDWNVRACLDWIERSGLFIVPLDNQREWYRYHHLFQELLQRRASAELGADQVSHLHRLASAWFEAQGLIDEALQHSLAAGDLDLAARQMSAGLREVINREDRLTLERWLRMLPEEMIQQHPELLIIRAWILQFLWRLDLQAKVLQQIEELLEAGAGNHLPDHELQILRAQLVMLKAQLAFLTIQPELAIDLCRQALAVLPPYWTYGRGSMMLYLSISMQASGFVLEAERLLRTEFELNSDETDIYILYILLSLCYIYLFSGQLEKIKQIGPLLIQKANQIRILTVQNDGEWLLGAAYYYCNELEKAEQLFSHVFENYTTHNMHRSGAAGLALIHQIKGKNVEANKVVETMCRFDLELSGMEDIYSSSLRSRLMLLQGDLEGACCWADTFTDPPPNSSLIWLDEPHVNRARILLARGSQSDLRSVMEILDTLDAIVERTKNTRYKIEILALRALALEAQANAGAPYASASPNADDVLKEALELAQPGGFVRIFVDLGQPMQAMLRRLARQGYPVGTIQRILAAFPADDTNAVSRESLAQPEPRPMLGNSTLAEPLTRRELEVLALLRGPFSIKEIAQKLSISYATGKDHTLKIYAKLGVNRRWDAVARAEELNILPPR